MADAKASALTAASALDGTEIVAGVQGGLDRKITTQAIADLGGGGGGGLDGLRVKPLFGMLWDDGTATSPDVFGCAAPTFFGTGSVIAPTSSDPYWANFATAATTSAQAYVSTNGAQKLLRVPYGADSHTGWSVSIVFQLPDADYGSGATGARIGIGVGSGTAVATEGGAYGDIGLSLFYSTNVAGNWKILALNYTNTHVSTDTGIAFASGTWEFTTTQMPGTTDTEWSLRRLDGTATASGTVATNRNAGLTTSVAPFVALRTLTTVSRNIRVSRMLASHIDKA